MSAATSRLYAAFRLNLEHQKNRAKDLLKAARSGDPAAVTRLGIGGSAKKLQLALAQHCIARELRFANWAALKLHIEAMAQTRAALDGGSRDSDCRTMHIRCGDDIRQPLLEAGFTGTFNRHINPYLQGPVTDAPGWLEQRARFIMDSAGSSNSSLSHDSVLQGLQIEESELAGASRDYERVVLWLEHDRYDQFVLLRCLSWFAEHGAPPHLELVGRTIFRAQHASLVSASYRQKRCGYCGHNANRYRRNEARLVRSPRALDRRREDYCRAEELALG
jgi:hypothetical protein